MESKFCRVDMMTDNNSNWVPSMSKYIDEEALMKLIQRHGI